MRGPLITVVLLAGLGFSVSALGAPDPFKAQLDQAKQLRLAGDHAKSEQIVKNVLTQSPGNFRATYTQGVLQLDSGDPKTAVMTLNRALVSQKGQPPPDPTIYNTLGYALMRTGRLDEAAATFQKQYQCGCTPDRASKAKLLNNMSLVYRLKGDTAAAQKYQQEASAAH